MNNDIRNSVDHLPKEKKEPPLGKRHERTFTGQNTFAADKEQSHTPLTTVRGNKYFPQLQSNGRNLDPDSYRECDSNKGDSSPEALGQLSQLKFS